MAFDIHFLQQLLVKLKFCTKIENKNGTKNPEINKRPPLFIRGLRVSEINICSFSNLEWLTTPNFSLEVSATLRSSQIIIKFQCTKVINVSAICAYTLEQILID